MKQIRIGVFETNSSSTHSLCIVSKEDYDKWINGELRFREYFKSERFVPNVPENSEVGVTFEEYEEETFDDYSPYTPFHEEFETPSGDKMVAFGYYGYNG